MKRGLPVVLVFALLLGLSSQAFGAAKIGSSCSKVSSFQQSGKTLLVCDVVKKKKVWRKASNIEVRLYNQERIRLAKAAADKAAADKAAADKAAADKAASIPIVLSWEYSSEIPLIPGTLADGSPDSVQDQNLNSSFVVKAMRDGAAVEGVEIIWNASDSTSKIVPFSGNTDKLGLARIWYFAGEEQNQKIEVRTLKLESNNLSVSLARSAVLKKTVGRYVSTYFDAPEIGAQENYDGFQIKVVPKSSPVNTYYQLIASWQKNNPDLSFYGGLQQANCGGPRPAAASILPSVCDKSRGEFAGRVALFSAWDAPSKSGPTPPKVVSLGPNTGCKSFDGEGSGQQCFQLLDWKVGESVTWKVELIGQIVPGYYRTRTSVALSNTQDFVEVVTIDLPAEPNLRSISPFNEEWGGNESLSCLDVQSRELEVISLDFFKNARAFKPTKGIALGGLYSDQTTRCQNYSITSTTTGITIKSGGKNHWVNISPIIEWNSSNLPFKRGFVDQSQTLWPWQNIDIAPLRR